MNEQITTSTGAGADAPETANLYAIDQAEFDIDVNVSPNAKRKLIVTHTLLKPTQEQLARREQESLYETEEVAQNEDVVKATDSKANGNLWDAIVKTVTGYRFGKADTHPLDQPRELTDEQKAMIPTEHKVAACRGLYVMNAEIEVDEEAAGFVISGDGEVVVVQTIGASEPAENTLRWTLEEPTDRARAYYRDNTLQVRNVRGSRKQRSKVVTNLAAAVKSFDEHFKAVEGASFEGKPVPAEMDDVTRARFLKTLDPVFKSVIIGSAMRAQDATLSDS